MGQAKIRKLNGTYPEQTPKPLTINVLDAGQAFFKLYRKILNHLQQEFPEHCSEKDQEEKAYAALTRMMELGAKGVFSLEEPLVLLATWQDRTGGWITLSMPEKRAAAKKIAETGRLPTGKGLLEYLAFVNVQVKGDTVTFGAGSPWMQRRSR
ncbi:hypothetical protein HAQ01_16155 [Acidithiobacillus thiooxidans]|uniref:hypothetical protein n=1 Tax=Acidithiobacillus thiooxidans TaxID=930 RepID=UPI001C07E301|nr:hypothetical protein [Acidithiobacillus thiooxidans]MBU2794880.1 hypothetical protein [Acidithiobacillus thiooxidans]